MWARANGRRVWVGMALPSRSRHELDRQAVDALARVVGQGFQRFEIDLPGRAQARVVDRRIGDLAIDQRADLGFAQALLRQCALELVEIGVRGTLALDVLQMAVDDRIE